MLCATLCRLSMLMAEKYTLKATKCASRTAFLLEVQRGMLLVAFIVFKVLAIVHGDDQSHGAASFLSLAIALAAL